jgi:ribosomal protein S18 acetylase RimI-like enzyme
MIVIRQCTHEDFTQIFLLLQQLWPEKTLDYELLCRVYSRGLESVAQRHLCAVEDMKIVGFCSLTILNSLWQAGHLAHIDELVVNQEKRGQGIGTALLDAITKVAREAGSSTLELDSAFHRSRAHKFYEQQGFTNRAYLFSKPL